MEYTWDLSVLYKDFNDPQIEKDFERINALIPQMKTLIGSGKEPAALMEEVTDYALNEQNFYLYQMYRASSSQETDFKKIMGIK